MESGYKGWNLHSAMLRKVTLVVPTVSTAVGQTFSR